MSWIISGALMFISSVVMYLLIRKVQKDKINNTVINFAMFACAIPLLGIFMLLAKADFTLTLEQFAILFISAYLFSYLGNKFSLNGIKDAPNPGYSLVIQKSYAVYTAFAAVILFNSPLKLSQLLAMLVIIAGSAMVVLDNGQVKKALTAKWVVYSLLALFMFGNLALRSKYLINGGMSSLPITFYAIFFSSIFFSWDFFKAKSQQLKFSKITILMLAVIGICSALFNFFMIQGFVDAPNVAFINIINASSISALTLFSAWLFKDKLTALKLLGVLAVIAGLGLLLLL